MVRLLHDREVRCRLTDALCAALAPHLLRVSLYGSRARGDALPSSDYDVLLVTDRPGTDLKLAAADVAERLATDHMVEVSVRVIPACEFERLCASGVAFWRKFAREEVVLWRRPS